ncbi:transposable element Tc1 transposase [Trichonephila clavipes]|nr:transposable element Tc1 transposase [Trichonephila clavipes]
MNLALLLKQMTIVFGSEEGGLAVSISLVLQRHTTITPDVTMWGAMSYRSRSSLVILHTSLTAQRYVDTILRPVVLFFMARYSGPIFQQDNTRTRNARISLKCLRAVNNIPWPARSLDLSPIKHVCNMVVYQIRALKMSQIWSNK